MVAGVIRILIGFALASLAAAVTQVLFVITPADLYGLEGEARWQRIGFAGLVAVSAATQSAVFSAPFAAIAVVVGIVQGIRGWAYYVFAGLVISLTGFATLYAGEASGQPTIANGYAVAAFAFAGIIAGYVYWIVAGHRAGGRRQEGASDEAVDEDVRDHLKVRDIEPGETATPGKTDASAQAKAAAAVAANGGSRPGGSAARH